MRAGKFVLDSAANHKLSRFHLFLQSTHSCLIPSESRTARGKFKFVIISIFFINYGSKTIVRKTSDSVARESQNAAVRSLQNLINRIRRQSVIGRERPEFAPHGYRTKPPASVQIHSEFSSSTIRRVKRFVRRFSIRLIKNRKFHAVKTHQTVQSCEPNITVHRL